MNRPVARALAALALALVLAVPALAGDAAGAKRCLDSAKEYMRQTRWHDAMNQVEKGLELLDGLDDATKGPLQKELLELKKTIPQEEFKLHREQFIERLRKDVESIKEILDNKDDSHIAGEFRRNYGGLYRLDQIETKIQLDKEGRKGETKSGKDDVAPTNYLDEATRAQFLKQVAELRKTGEEYVLKQDLAREERSVVELEDVASGKAENKYQYDDSYYKSIAQSQETLKKLAENDPRVKALIARLEAARAAYVKRAASRDHDADVALFQKEWKDVLESYGKQSEGWEQEAFKSGLQDFWSRSFGCEKTQERHSLTERFLGYDNVPAIVKKYPDDPLVKATYGEVMKLREETATKICKGIERALDEADKATPEKKHLDDVKYACSSLDHILQNAAKGAKERDALIARLKALEAKWVAAIEGADKAKKDLVEKLSKAATEVWPSFKKEFSTTEIDAGEAAKDIGSWKGKLILLERPGSGNWNRMGWDWDGDYVFTISVHGSPVCANFDGGVLSALADFRERTGVDWEHDGGDFDGMVGVVEGKCRVKSQTYSQITQKYYETGTWEAPLLRIVAFKSGPWAISVKDGTNLSKAGLKDISVSESGSTRGGKGGGGAGRGALWSWVLRLMSWFECLVAFLGGVLAIGYGAEKFVPQLAEQRAKAGKWLGIAGLGFAGYAVLWILYTGVIFDLLPAGALFLAGAFVGVDYLKMRGVVKEELAKQIQPLGIVLGAGSLLFAALHFILWDRMFL